MTTSRITLISTDQLGPEHVHFVIECISARTGAIHSGQVLRIKNDLTAVTVLLGPPNVPLEVTLEPTSQVRVLDATTEPVRVSGFHHQGETR